MPIPLPKKAAMPGKTTPKSGTTRGESLNTSLQRDIAQYVKMTVFKPEQRAWLDTGSPELNRTLGSAKRGLRYGGLIELRGIAHGGKTAISLYLAGLAQKDGAAVGLIDVEDSRDRSWSEKYQIDYDNMIRIYPKLIQRKGKLPRLESAEELFEEAETAMALLAARGFKKQFWILDSIAMLRTRIAITGGKKQEAKGEKADRNMRANADRALFLSEKLPEWVAKAAAYNICIVLVNQMRTKPGVMYGDPRYSPGGDALIHACHVRANVGRLKNGRLKNGDQTVGLLTKIENFKNKAGGKSVQSGTCAVRIRWDKDPARIKVMSVGEAEKELG